MTDQQTKYVDGFVLVIPKDKVDAYRKMAQDGAKLWMKYGALNYKECMHDDPNPAMVVPGMDMLTFPAMAKAGPDETVWFSYIEFKSKAHRDEVNAKVMQDPFMQSMGSDQMKNSPFDMKRFAYGGFEVIVSGE